MSDSWWETDSPLLCSFCGLAIGSGNPTSLSGISNVGGHSAGHDGGTAMFARTGVFSSFGRSAVVVAVLAVGMTAIEPSIANAGSSPAGKGLTEAKSTATDISARRRHYHGGGGGAAAAAAFAGIVGTGLAIVAAQNRRDYYDDGYYGGPRYYAPAPHYYGGYGHGPHSYGEYGGGYQSYG